MAAAPSLCMDAAAVVSRKRSCLWQENAKKIGRRLRESEKRWLLSGGTCGCRWICILCIACSFFEK